MGAKPYCVTGAYLDRMSNACKGCRDDPKKATGPDACPFTTRYWDFLARHERLLARNQRVTMQLKNRSRKPAADVWEIRRQADNRRGQMSSRAAAHQSVVVPGAERGASLWNTPGSGEQPRR